MSELVRLRFQDLATEMEKHSNDHIGDDDSANRLGAAVEGVCADRIRAILKDCFPEPTITLSEHAAQLQAACLTRERIAQIAAHRACCNEEHDPANGKLAGFCVVCGVPWPCSYAGTPPIKSSEMQAACVELRETAATCCAERANDLEEGSHVYAPDIDPFADRRQSSIGELREVAKLIRAIPIPTAALETALDKKQTETITACASAVCEGCRNNWMLAHGAHQTPHQGEWFPCKADAIWALSPHTIQKSKALFEAAILEMRDAAILEMRDRYAKSFASPIREAILSLPLPSTAALETAIAEARLEVAVEISERSVHGMIPDGFELWLDDYVEEKKAALDAAKAKVRE